MTNNCNPQCVRATGFLVPRRGDSCRIKRDLTWPRRSPTVTLTTGGPGPDSPPPPKGHQAALHNHLHSLIPPSSRTKETLYPLPAAQAAEEMPSHGLAHLHAHTESMARRQWELASTATTSHVDKLEEPRCPANGTLTPPEPTWLLVYCENTGGG
ncbi:Hypothetical predicted protein [Pelobates cultripes]|uniref:Uncharacterized protein n=1 Tax=Pelobates cultripes TaxID=61616 RepID=A0AAD1R3R4_PELCU|nr:Hypothetical predicted protein [Pelobates cultripes]